MYMYYVCTICVTGESIKNVHHSVFPTVVLQTIAISNKRRRIKIKIK